MITLIIVRLDSTRESLISIEIDKKIKEAIFLTEKKSLKIEIPLHRKTINVLPIRPIFSFVVNYFEFLRFVAHIFNSVFFYSLVVRIARTPWGKISWASWPRPVASRRSEVRWWSSSDLEVKKKTGCQTTENSVAKLKSLCVDIFLPFW